MWFPQPSSPAAIEVVGLEGKINARDIAQLLSDGRAKEWRDRVGVVGARDGSAKPGSRLLVNNGWVLKTNVDFGSSDRATVFERMSTANRLHNRVRLWHEDKAWALFESDGTWYPLSVAPEVRTLRQLGHAERRIVGWTAMIAMGVEISRASGIGLDLNPSNFGYLGDSDRLYYVDDEWYPMLTNAELASAIVARIPESLDIGPDRWQSWGVVLADVLSPLFGTDAARRDFADTVTSHPVATRYNEARKKLVDGLVRARVGLQCGSDRHPRRKFRRAPERTAVLADIHANIIAFEAVLAECERLEVDSYIFLGDVVGYGPNPKECVQRLAELPDAKYVRGNHDHAIGTGVFKDGMNRTARSCAGWTLEQLSLEEREWLISMPVDLAQPKWLAVHGAPRDPNRFLAYVYELTFQDNLYHMEKNDLELCFCGHTHVQFVHEKIVDGGCRKLGAPSSVDLSENRLLIVNPGSVGQPRDNDVRAAFAVWDRDVEAISLHRTRYDVNEVVRRLKRCGLPDGLGERLLQGT